MRTSEEEPWFCGRCLALVLQFEDVSFGEDAGSEARVCTLTLRGLVGHLRGVGMV